MGGASCQSHVRCPTARRNRIDRHARVVERLLSLLPRQVPPKCPNSLKASRAIRSCTDGISAKPLFDSSTDQAKWKARAISQVPRGALVDGEPGNAAGEIYMGYTVRVAAWRYTEWVGFDNNTGVADWATVVGTELYEETLGRGCKFDTDSVNVVADPAHASTVAELHAMLRTIV